MLERLKDPRRYFSMLGTAYRLLCRNLSIAREWWDTYVWKPRKQARTPYGFLLIVGSYRANHSMQRGTYEPEETNLIEQLLREADVFVDVGANLGFYTCLARQASKHVIAVEPQVRNLELLYQNLMVNHWPDVEVYPVGLSDRPGLATLYGATGTGASLLKGWAGYSARFRETIPVSTLDILLGERFAGQKLLIKIDVEGAEYAVLQGSERTLARSPRPTWLIEICLGEYHPAGRNPNYAATFELLWQNGYEAHTANREDRLLMPADIERWVCERRSDSRVINYIFVPSVGKE